MALDRKHPIWVFQTHTKNPFDDYFNQQKIVWIFLQRIVYEDIVQIILNPNQIK